MKEYIYNYDNLIEDDITETVIRMKVLLIDSKKIILGYERGIYQFPGGHLEENETFEDCVKREVLEETGIEILDNQIEPPIYKISYLSKDWPEVGKNRKSETYYYVVKTDKKPDLSKVNYTEHELTGKFKVEEIPLNCVIQILNENINNNEKNKIITPDMIRVIKEYKKLIGME